MFQQALLAVPLNSRSFEECNVEDGSVEVDKLEDVQFGDETVLVLSLCAVEFCEE